MRFDEQFIRHAVSDVSIIGTLPIYPSFVVDSRNVQKDTIFVALPGNFHDGHMFVVDALHKGAIGALIAADKKDFCMHQINQLNVNRPIVLIVVSNPLHALTSMAIAWRNQFTYPVIGVTGSVGKTSAKETIAAVLKKANKSCIISQGNENTHIGIALNMLRMRPEHEVAVFEMGISRRGEMAILANMLRPTIGVITAIAHCHMEGLGSLQDIASEKRDIFKYFTEENIGIINGDQPLISQVSFIHPVIRFGTKTTNQIQARKIRIINGEMHCILKIYKKKYAVVLPKFHVSAITSALVAAAVGHVLTIDHAIIVEALQKLITITGRFEKRKLKKGKGVIINDCYNANPESMKAALVAFEHLPTGMPKVAIIGDMLELGINSPFWHRQIGRFLRKIPSIKKVLLVGTMVEWIEKSLPIHIQAARVADWQEAQDRWADFIGREEVCVLVKGSHGIGLMNLVDYVTK
jgi:UDP-N-acetylmuramoyl-tripeptide--D-alanyl-D-alanine ligase